MYQPVIEYIRDKSVLLVGFGREGRSTLAYIRRYLPGKHITVADRNPVQLEDPDVTLLCSEDYLSGVSRFDVVFKSPGIPFIGVDTGNARITCQLDMFLHYAPFEVIGVTGTKGKTSTTTLVYKMLEAAGKSAVLAGNMGLPVFDYIDKEGIEVAAVEMSSHQLEFTTASPHTAILTNLHEEHLDHYADGYKGYINSKLNITRYQKAGDVLIYDPEGLDECVPPLAGVAGGSLQTLTRSAVLKDEFIKSLVSGNEHLAGAHNLHDVAFAAAAVRRYGVEDEAIGRAVRGFEGIPHRMEYVCTNSGIRFYNDSIATVPFAVMSGINALGDTGSLIFGGLDRGIDYTEFTEFLAKSPIKVLIGMPDTGHAIIDALERKGASPMLFKARDMEQAVSLAYAHTPRGMCCLFSPAAASYNAYKDFEQKGEHFKALVKSLGAREDGKA